MLIVRCLVLKLQECGVLVFDIKLFLTALIDAREKQITNKKEEEERERERHLACGTDHTETAMM